MSSNSQWDSYIEGGVLIDVRTPEEWDEEHIEEAILIPNYELKNEISNYVPNLETPINAHCEHGIRSANAKALLLKLGYKKVANLGSYGAAKRAYNEYKNRK
ncbi:Rhodanese-like domain containing protein [Trichomonas vaginalis G3]|uniref:Rhodanese-like domain containing protein n=1 Tax=Trichomonas vaginalis (strain ATCC PRA-98 / G3) TaxID=412133 RepID=A2FAQ9_TRIV3|nr:rhodanese/cell cycle control phosphatase family [Trichomonas vaginalis G3]EAX97988.1 Rhodanese-like domain containing protein [Trichomonas vaginalis G3]KAI5521904.1 rhodanese/cell cycle control phosphatase family [Trichomonas vaginalis G3]|eukprot:XP_001310918.1 Rhodanese-like domain containing protein [Trichomonas vaginalis G3]